MRSIVLVNRYDLIKRSKDVPLEEVGTTDLSISMDLVLDSHIVIFVDEDRLKVIKNRYAFPVSGGVYKSKLLYSLLEAAG